jgi:UDP-N-acetylmuramoylalanine--D-glutamate ligase
MDKNFKTIQAFYKNKTVLVVGLGLQGGGVGVAKFFAELGSNVIVTDKKTKDKLQSSVDALSQYSITYRLVVHEREDFLSADVIFKGPSVPWNMPELVEASEKGIPVEMEASFFASYCPCPIVGITGTRGKSTTTQMIYQLLKKAGRSVFLAGNIPQNPMINLLTQVKDTDIIVAELSSWQLSGFHKRKISPHISVFTNLYPDHLNYYPSMDEYFYDKSAIYQYQKENDLLIANKSLGRLIEKQKSKSHISYFDETTFPGHISLLGSHNQENAGAAYLVARELGIDQTTAVQTIQSFSGLPYRLEKIVTIDGIDVINDTTSTTPIACEKAINALGQRKITLILGGNSKNLPFDSLLTKLSVVNTIVLLKGTFTDQIIDQLDKTKVIGTPFDNLEEAVLTAFTHCDPKGVILFSPAATSFAQFKNEFHRGDEFNRIVRLYEKNNKKTGN